MTDVEAAPENRDRRVRERLRRIVRNALSLARIRNEKDDGEDNKAWWDEVVLKTGADLIEKGFSEEQIAEVISAATLETIQKGGKLVADSVWGASRKSLRQSQRLRNGFEKRLKKRWRPALDAFVVVLECSIEVGEGVYQRNMDTVTGTPHAAKLEALTRLHARACRVAGEVLALISTGFPVGALARWRTIHELSVVANLLAEHDPGLSERFLDHAAVQRWLDARAYNRFAGRLKREPFSDDEMDEFKVAAAQVISKHGQSFGESNGWAAALFDNPKAIKFVALEKMVRLDHLRPYYNLGSHGVHAGSMAAELNIISRGGERMHVVGQVNAGLAEPAQSALISLTQVTMCLLLYGPPEPQFMETLLAKALNHMVDEAQERFSEIETAIENAEERIWHESDLPLNGGDEVDH